ncbi:MAG TPA: hypothetical protein VLD36_15640 [Burkholderiales bacterium]|nr:hypothetical protein [Burkholderiales bacterium]
MHPRSAAAEQQPADADPATSATDRVAVVVVHGIADQRPGQTVLEVARLLCRGGRGAPPYDQGEMHHVLVPVDKLGPGGGHPQAAAPPTPPAGEARKPEPARRMPGMPSGFYQKQKPESAGTGAAAPEPQVPESRAPGPHAPESQDLGIALNDYLLGRLELPEGDALYEAARVSLRRRAGRRAVDVYEMYWADLSRLGTGGLRALSSMYQLFFHLGTLAADLVDQASLSMNGGTAWRLLQRFHAWIAWLMKGPAAVLQLAMLLMVAFGAAALVAHDLQGPLLAAVFGVGSIVLLALAALAWLRGPPGPARWALSLFLLAAALGSLGTAVYALRAETRVLMIYFGASALAVTVLGAYLVERYSRVTEGVRLLGHLVVLASVVALCFDGNALLPDVTTQAEWMLTAALNVGEWLLAALLLVWAAFVAIQIVALLLGLWLGSAGDRAVKASLHTARLALVGSSGLFAVLSLVLWSVISFVATRALTDLRYEPVVFGTGYRSAEIFLEGRVQTVGAFFTPLVAAFTLLLAAALLVLLPSLIEEIRPTANVDAKGIRKGAAEWATRLGNWLGGGVRLLETAFKPLIPLGALAGSVLYLAFVLEQFAFTAGVGADLFMWLVGRLEWFQGETLVAAGKWLAGGALTITALGSRFTETFGRLRVAVDAVLDIDNYFGDPPNRQPPRGRIFSRYASLLGYLRDAGYARIVIVAHSQGTVISADLLRYLHVQGRLQDVVAALPIALVTVGSPLRDLYAERFPLLYRWMGSRDAGFAQAAPAAADLGATEWVNVCRSGDYVGRFIWTPDGDAARFGVAAVGADGRVDARRAGDRTEFCLGAGGHTHYFSNDAVALAVEIERVVAGVGA